MELELKLPYAELYGIVFPQKRYSPKKLKEYVRTFLTDYHPGFGTDSLWDYKVVTNNSIKKIEAVVLNREFYLEKRLSDEKVSFYIISGNNQKVRLFELSDFNEKGERRRKRIPLFVFVLTIIFVIFGIVLFMRTSNKPEPVQEVKDEISVIENAVNIFDILNTYAGIIKEHDAKMQSIQYASDNKGHIKVLLSDCEPYSLVSDFSSKKFTEKCRCANVVYNKGKETFELDILVKLTPILQNNMGEIELLALQNQFINELHNIDVNLVSTGISSDSGRISSIMECMLKDLSVANKKLNDFCEKNNFFIIALDENISGNKVTIKIDFICLPENQNIEKSVINERISEVFALEEKIDYQTIINSEKIQKGVKTEKTKGWKKIGSTKKEGKQLYYYRTEEGKIEISEVDYE